MTKKETNNKKRMQGVVVKVGSINTITVMVETKTTHPLYKKIVKTHKKYLVQNTDKTLAVNDKVIIEEGKPVSKNKSFYFVKKIA